MAGNWKLAWVTGASSGIGQALALELAKAGVRVVASARNAERLDALSGNQSLIESYPLDVTDGPGLERAVEDIERGFGPIDLAVLNAGVGYLMSARKFDLGKIQTSLDTNYMGVIHGLNAVMPRMIERGGGQIALMASPAGYRGMARGIAYSPPKAALINLAECLYNDLKRHNVTVSVINPGFVTTPMTSRNDFKMPFCLQPEDAARRILTGLRAGRFEISFPWQLIWPLKFLSALPYPIYFWWMRKMMAKNRR